MTDLVQFEADLTRANHDAAREVAELMHRHFALQGGFDTPVVESALSGSLSGLLQALQEVVDQTVLDREAHLRMAKLIEHTFDERWAELVAQTAAEEGRA